MEKAEALSFFCSPNTLQVSPYVASEHDDRGLKRAEWDQREKINFSPLDPVTQESRVSLREPQPSVERMCLFEVRSGRLNL